MIHKPSTITQINKDIQYKRVIRTTLFVGVTVTLLCADAKAYIRLFDDNTSFSNSDLCDGWGSFLHAIKWLPKCMINK